MDERNKKENFIISFYLNKAEVLRTKAGKFPLKLCVYDRALSKRRYYGTDFYFTPEEYDEITDFVKLEKGKRSKEYLEKEKMILPIKKQLSEIEEKAKKIAASMEQFSLSGFSELYLHKKKRTGETVDSFYDAEIEELKKAKRIGTATAYNSSLKALQKFRKEQKKKGNFLFNEVTASWLTDFENYCSDNHLSKTTVGIHIRHLRAIYRKAIAENVIPAGYYPFYSEERKKGYKIPEPETRHKALDNDGLKKLFTAEPETPEQQKALDFWIFSFISNGMNVKDILKLRYKNLNEDTFSFYRAKTLLTTKTKLTPIEVVLQDHHRQTIEKYGNRKITKNTYLFDILNDKMTPEDEHRAIQNFTRFINQHLQILAKKIGLPKISTYTARHSWASLLLRKNVNIDFIRQELGHTDIKTTQSYLSSIKSDERKNISDSLLDFLDEK